MTTPTPVSPHGTRPTTGRRRDPDRRRGWLALVLLPVAFVLAMVLGEALLSWQGYDSEDSGIPLTAVAVASVPAMLVLLTSPLGMVWFGHRAERRGGQGDDLVRGGLVLAGLLVALNVMPLLLT